MQESGVNLNRAASRAAAEQVYRAAAAHHLKSPVPSRRGADRLDGRVSSVGAFGEAPHRAHRIVQARNVEGNCRSKPFRSLRLARPLSQRDYTESPLEKNPHELESVWFLSQRGLRVIALGK